MHQYLKTQLIKMKQTIIISAITTVVILAVAIAYSKNQVKNSKKGLFA